MKKMPCLFVREFHGRNSHTITDQVTPGCEWVLAGEGVATVKWDGTACLVKNRALWKRYDAKVNPKTGVRKEPPPGALPCDPEPDPVTGHWPHWVRVDPHKAEDRRHVEAWQSGAFTGLDEGTYELVGPAVNGNPHYLSFHRLIRHGTHRETIPDLSFDGIRSFLSDFFYEGIVFHHLDGRMCKIRRADFAFPWPLKPRIFPLGFSSRSQSSLVALVRGWSSNASEPLLQHDEEGWSSDEWHAWADGSVSEKRALSCFHLVSTPCGRAVKLEVCEPEKWDVTFADTPRAAWEAGRVMRVDARRRPGTGAGRFYCTVWVEETGRE